VASQYVACYAFGKQKAPWKPHGREGTTIHIGRPGAILLGYTLCGRKVSRTIAIFAPSEASCRERKWGWELATGAPIKRG